MVGEGSPAIAAAVGLLSAPQGLPAAFYCVASKDRTGVLAAVVLATVGVPDETIVADFHLSEARVAWIVERATTRRHTEADSAMLSQPRAVRGAPPEAIRHLLAHIREQHGSAEAYLQSHGVSDAQLAALRDGLLDPIAS